MNLAISCIEFHVDIATENVDLRLPRTYFGVHRPNVGADAVYRIVQVSEPPVYLHVRAFQVADTFFQHRHRYPLKADESHFMILEITISDR